MSIEQKIEICVDIWVDKGSLPDTEAKRNQKYNEILEKILSKEWKEIYLDTFIRGHTEGLYK